MHAVSFHNFVKLALARAIVVILCIHDCGGGQVQALISFLPGGVLLEGLSITVYSHSIFPK